MELEARERGALVVVGGDINGPSEACSPLHAVGETAAKGGEVPTWFPEGERTGRPRMLDHWLMGGHEDVTQRTVQASSIWTAPTAAHRGALQRRGPDLAHDSDHEPLWVCRRVLNHAG